MKTKLTKEQIERAKDLAVKQQKEFEDNLDTVIRATIPALPGTYTVMYDFSVDEVFRENVVAWVIAGKESFFFPLTGGCGWVSNSYGKYDAVLFPDGRVEAYEATWQTEALWLEDARARAKRRAENEKRRQESEDSA